MCPVPAGRGPLSDDRTARARIRDAALELFAERGYAGASIRNVAQAAGVSPGLVQHHYETKAGLRAGCDEYVMATLEAVVRRASGGEEVTADLVSALYEVSQPIIRYIARALVEDSASGEQLFDRTTALTERWLTEHWPDRFPAGSMEARSRAATMAAMRLGAVVLHEHLGRWMGVDPLSAGNLYLLGSASLDVFVSMGEYLSTGEGRRIREALQEFERREAARGGRGGGKGTGPAASSGAAGMEGS